MEQELGSNGQYFFISQFSLFSLVVQRNFEKSTFASSFDVVLGKLGSGTTIFF